MSPSNNLESTLSFETARSDSCSTPSLSDRDSPKLSSRSAPLQHSLLKDGSLEVNPILCQGLENFKVFRCRIRVKHNHKQCYYYHYPKDRRRALLRPSGKACKFIEEPNLCPQGDNCPHYHSKVEELHHPENFKTKYCLHYLDKSKECEFGEYCSFAHKEEELIIELLHKIKEIITAEEFYTKYHKTVWCPNNLFSHDRARCEYAHNWQDYRRPLDRFYYAPKLCLKWRVDDFVVDYNDGGCPQGKSCRHCHGWKELEYHPNYYKTRKCTLKNCLRKVCPYYHNEAEKRVNAAILNPPNRDDDEEADSLFRLISKYYDQSKDNTKNEIEEGLDLKYPPAKFHNLPASVSMMPSSENFKWPTKVLLKISG